MPKSMNIKKAASAMNQNMKQIKAAFDGVAVTFASVEKSLGRAQFLLNIKTEKGIKSVTGTPRGLFTSGTMRISAGQIVIVDGSEKLGFEIVARIDDLSDAQKLVKLGALSADLLASAQVAGSKSGLVTIAEDDGLFDYSETQEGIVEPSMKGGVKGARKQQESLAAATALAGRLGSSSARNSVRVEDATDMSIYAPLDEFMKKTSKPAKPSKPSEPSTEVSAEQVTLDFGGSLWDGGVDEPVKPVVLARSVLTSWEDVDIDAI